MTKDIRSEGVGKIEDIVWGCMKAGGVGTSAEDIAKHLWDNGIRPDFGFRVAILKNKEARSSADKPLKQYIVPTEEGGE